LGLSIRQIRRLKDRLALLGPSGLVHGNRGRCSSRRLDDDVRSRLAELANTAYSGRSYRDLPKLLVEREGFVVSWSTLRRVLVEAGVRSARPRTGSKLPPGAMPIAFNLGQRHVDLLELVGADFREPSFQRTVERWRRERNPSATRLDLAAFAE